MRSSGSGYTTTRAALTYPVSEVQEFRPAVRTSRVAPRAPVRTAYVERRPERDWKKTAMVIGGSSAAGAGLGAIFGGKKGALIGAAIGGGAGTLYEVSKGARAEGKTVRRQSEVSSDFTFALLPI